MDGIMAFFRRCYREGDIVFLGSDRPDEDNDLIIQPIVDGKAKTVFAFVHMGDHWGVALIDLTLYETSFGDSLSRKVPVEAIDALINRIKNIQPPKKDKSKWIKAKSTIATFDVPRQDAPGACGILAAVAIEKYVNQFFDWDSSSQYLSSKFHRIRFLRILTGYLQ